MKSLKTLVRVQKWNVDKERRHLSKLLARQHELQALGDELERSVIEEQDHASQMESGGQIFAAYAQSVLLARQKLAGELNEIQDDLKIAQEAVAASFRKLKKYELIEEEIRLQERLEQKHKDQAAFDELAGVRAFRKKT